MSDTSISNSQPFGSTLFMTLPPENSDETIYLTLSALHSLSSSSRHDRGSFRRLGLRRRGETTSQFQQAMIPLGRDLYSLTINPEVEIISQVGFPGAGEAWLQYQTMLQNLRGDTSTRTPFSSDVTLALCPEAVRQ